MHVAPWELNRQSLRWLSQASAMMAADADDQEARRKQAEREARLREREAQMNRNR